MKYHHGLGIIALAAYPVLALRPHGHHGISRRADDTCRIQLAQSNGGRKVAFAIDSSGSMASSDPAFLRVEASKQLTRQLVSTPGNGKSADQLAVVDFDNNAAVIYNLGTPSGAGPAIDTIDSSGGTSIAEGLEAAITELTKPGSGETAGRTGVLVLTDGEDSQTAPLITQLERAASLGIRVSFGFLAPPNSFSNAPLLAAILRTGGTYASFQTAEAIQSFLFVILSNGLTAADTPAGTTQAILPGVTVARLNAGAAAPVLFSYDAVVGEVLRFEFRSMSRQTIDGELTAPGLATPARNTSLGTVRTPASITYTASAAGPVVLAISSADTAEGVFEVSLNSSLGISACNLNNTAPIVSDPPFGNNGTSAGPTGGPVTVETTITTTVCSTDPAGAVHTQTKTLVVGGKCPKGCYHGGPAITDAPGKPPAPVATATPTRVKVNAAVGMAPEGIAVRALGLAGLAIGFAVLA